MALSRWTFVTLLLLGANGAAKAACVDQVATEFPEWTASDRQAACVEAEASCIVTLHQQWRGISRPTALNRLCRGISDDCVQRFMRVTTLLAPEDNRLVCKFTDLTCVAALNDVGGGIGDTGIILKACAVKPVTVVDAACECRRMPAHRGQTEWRGNGTQTIQNADFAYRIPFLFAIESDRTSCEEQLSTEPRCHIAP